MEKNKRRQMKLPVVLWVGILLIIVGFGVSFNAVLHQQHKYDAWKQETLASGPWAEESTWIAEHGEAYLVSRRRKDSGEMRVRLYYSEEGLLWGSTDFGLGQETGCANFTTNNAQVQGDLEIDGDTIRFSVTEAADEVSWWEDVDLTFTRRTREESQMNLPFDPVGF